MEAQQMAQIQAYDQQRSMTQKFANRDLGESSGAHQEAPVQPVVSVDALMGKMVMADMFDEDELDQVKQGLLLLNKQKQHKKKQAKKMVHPDLGESAGPVQVLNAGQAMARGLQLTEHQLAEKAAELKSVKGKLQEKQAEVDSLKHDKSSETEMLDSCETKTNHQIISVHEKYRKDIDGLAGRLQQASTQALLSKRALQMCEAKSKGSAERAIDRVTERTDRQMHRVETALQADSKAEEEKKDMQAQVEDAKEKLQEEFKAKMKQQAKLDNVSQLCAACSKLTQNEHNMLKVDCTKCS